MKDDTYQNTVVKINSKSWLTTAYIKLNTSKKCIIFLFSPFFLLCPKVNIMRITFDRIFHCEYLFFWCITVLLLHSNYYSCITYYLLSIVAHYMICHFHYRPVLFNYFVSIIFYIIFCTYCDFVRARAVYTHIQNDLFRFSSRVYLWKRWSIKESFVIVTFSKNVELWRI